MTRSDAFGRLAALAVAGLLGACGGGSDRPDRAPTFTVDATAITPREATTTVPFATGGFVATGATCSRSSAPTAGEVVYETDNTVTYTDGTVPAALVRDAARYAEAGVLTLRARFGLSATLGFNGSKLHQCVNGRGAFSTAGWNTIQVLVAAGAQELDRVTVHELVHVLQAQALGCTQRQYQFERWLMEGMALRVAGQDQPSKDDLRGLQALFADVATRSPFGDILNSPVSRYPAYRLAFDAFLGESRRSPADVLRFLQQYGATNGCPLSAANGGPAGVDQTGWKSEFDAAFGVDLRGAGALGEGFWAVASRYAW